MALTGMIDFRKSWLGGLTLQVEEEVKTRFSRKMTRRWRRATLMDLAQPELRILIDMRSRPYSLLGAPFLRSAPMSLAPAYPPPAAPAEIEQEMQRTH